jgi:hypothetical protein
MELTSPMPPSDPPVGVTIPLRVTSAFGPVPDGWIEASYEDQPAGLAPVTGGAARAIATFVPPRDGVPRVSLRYVPANSWWEASRPIVVDVPVQPPSIWRRAPWIVGIALAAYWIARAWKRPARSASPASKESM